VDWTDTDFYVEFGRIPTTVEEARELVAIELCDWCGHPHDVEFLVVYAGWLRRRRRADRRLVEAARRRGVDGPRGSIGGET
jgi:hypothetical protein